MSPRIFRGRVPAEAVESGAAVETAVEPAVETAVESGAAVETAVEPAVEPAVVQSESPAVVQSESPAVVQSVEPSASSAPTTRFRVSRWKLGDRKPHFDDFDVEVRPGVTLLDALLEIRRRLDPSLVVRHSCMHASCGTCGVRVNGRESLACDTRVDALPPGKPVKVEPLAGQRLVADLATDMADFYARFEPAAMPQLRAAGVPLGLAPLDSIQSFSRFENCIECGLCLSACPISRINRDYIGPAALAAAARVVAEPRGVALGPVLALASEPDSVWRCHSAMECTAVCPAGVDPAGALIGLRRHVAANGLKGLLGRALGRGLGRSGNAI